MEHPDSANSSVSVGLALAQAGVGALTFAEPTDLPRVAEVRLSWPVLTFALGVTMLTVLALSSASAWRAGCPDIVEWLKGAQRGPAGRASAGRLRSTLVVGQLAVSVVLLVGAGLLGRSFVVLLNQDPGFRTEGLLTIDLSSPNPEIRLTTGGATSECARIRAELTLIEALNPAGRSCDGEWLLAMLSDAGFEAPGCFWRYLNFAIISARKAACSARKGHPMTTS